MIFAIAFLTFFAGANAACDNHCSGHGSCTTDDVCACYDNWGIGLNQDSGDCSERICPYELAWVDSPDSVGKVHKYVQCSGKGICGVESGECTCFEGYEGKACQRTTCPNDCSGHGTCEYIEDKWFGATWNDYASAGFYEDPKTFDYNNWDQTKTRGCVCDASFGDVDCSKKMCPYGTDVLATRDNLLVSQKYQVQEIVFEPSEVVVSDLDGKTFALTFRSRLNETFTTIPLVFDSSDVTDFVHDVQLALLSLPNKVIDGVTVSGTNSVSSLSMQVTFTGASVEGPQHLLVVEDYECSDGCTPKITGLFLETREGITGSSITETNLADFNSYECGRRGKCDYSTGICGCFNGYTGDNCNTLHALF